MIKKYNEFINEGIFDLLSGYSMEEVKEKLNRLTPLERFKQLKKLKLTYEDVYTQEEIDNLTGLDKVYVSKKYDWIGDFIHGVSKVQLNDKFGVIDENGKEITPIIYDWISLYDNVAVVQIKCKCGLIDYNGNEIIPIKYDWIGKKVNNTIMVELNNKNGVFDINGKQITPIKYDIIADFVDNVADVWLNNKRGVIDVNGNEHWY